MTGFKSFLSEFADFVLADCVLIVTLFLVIPTVPIWIIPYGIYKYVKARKNEH